MEKASAIVHKLGGQAYTVLTDLQNNGRQFVFMKTYIDNLPNFDPKTKLLFAQIVNNNTSALKECELLMNNATAAKNELESAEKELQDLNNKV